jgi:hypothetical protein
MSGAKAQTTRRAALSASFAALVWHTRREAPKKASFPRRRNRSGAPQCQRGGDLDSLFQVSPPQTPPPGTQPVTFRRAPSLPLKFHRHKSFGRRDWRSGRASGRRRAADRAGFSGRPPIFRRAPARPRQIRTGRSRTVYADDRRTIATRHRPKRLFRCGVGLRRKRGHQHCNGNRDDDEKISFLFVSRTRIFRVKKGH